MNVNILERPLSVVHTGDIQIEVRGQHQRYDEYKFILSQLKDAIVQKHADLYIIAGDIFEHWNANDAERSLFIEHLKEVNDIPYLKEIVIIHGNHDINQRLSYNTYVTNGQDTTIPNAIDTIVTALKSEKILLLNDSAIYNSGIKGLQYLVWSQKVKHSPNKHLYKPNEIKQESTMITLYHDPVCGTKMWDDSDMKNSDRHPSLADFCTKTIIAGDIHKPQTITNEDKTFVYCGSPVPRNYGEGDYYEDGRLVVNGQSNHPYHSFTLNPDGTISNSVHIPLEQMRGYTTFTLSNKIENVDQVSWTILNPGTNETLVKVKLPSSSEFWVSKELDIISSIKKQNSNLKNLSISFVYGKMLTDTKSDDIDSVPIAELVSQEKIDEIAQSYISTLVAKSNSIPKDDKKTVEDTVKSLFGSAIKLFKDVSQSYNISLKSMKCSNFMAFGDDIELEFGNLPQITKLTGGNGVGKTTIYKFIKWMLTGYISSGQNKTKKKENCLVVFNDYRADTDSVVGELEFYLNGKLYTLNRSVSREWAKDVTTEQKNSKNWKEFVKSASMSISLDDKESDIYYDDLADEKLASVFCGFEQIEKLCFPDQFTLRSFINTGSAELVDQVLKFVGLGFFDNMLESYNEFKDSLLSKLEKPSKTVQVLTNEYVDLNNQLNEAIEKDRLVDESINETNQQIRQLTNDITEQGKLIVTPNAKELLAENQDNLSKERGKKTILEDKIEHLIDYIKNAKDGLEDKSSLEKSITDATTDKTNIKISISDLNNQVQSLTKDIKLKKQEGLSIVAELKAEHNEKINKINEELIVIQNKKNSLYVDKQNLSNRLINETDPKIEEYLKSISELEQSKRDLEISIRDTKSNIAIATKELNDLENSRTCPTCKREYTYEVLETILFNAMKVRTKIEKLNEEEKNLNNSISEADAKIEGIKNELEDWKKNPESLENSIHSAIHSIDIDIDECSKQIAGKQKLIDELPQIQDIVAKDERIHNIRKGIEELNANITSIKNTLIPNKERELEKVLYKIEIISKKLILIGSLDEHEKKQYQLELELNQTKGQISVLEKEEETLIKTIEYNKRISIIIEGLQTQYEKCIYNKDTILAKQKTDTSNRIAILKSSMETKKTEISNATKYKTYEQSFKLYKTLIGKNGLPQHIFKIVSSQLNAKLNDLLEDLNFRLEFNEDNELVMLDMSKNSIPQRSMSQLSGMQTCFAGLSLLYINRECNNQFIFDWLFIDEVSGQLNSGEDLTYESMNYQNQLKLLLSKFTSFKTMIVDHVIDDLGEESTIEVVPSASGSYLNVL